MLPQPESVIAASARSADAQPLTLALSRKGRGDTRGRYRLWSAVRCPPLAMESKRILLTANRQPLTASK